MEDQQRQQDLMAKSFKSRSDKKPPGFWYFFKILLQKLYVC